MTNYINSFDNNDSQHRTKETICKIEFLDGTLLIRKEQNTVLTESGDVNTTEIIHSSIIDGQHIFDPSQILGQCQSCRRRLTKITFRHCFLDSTIICAKCARYDEKDQRWLCKSCYKSIRWRRFWRALGRLLIYPFQRKDVTNA